MSGVVVELSVVVEVVMDRVEMRSQQAGLGFRLHDFFALASVIRAEPASSGRRNTLQGTEGVLDALYGTFTLRATNFRPDTIFFWLRLTARKHVKQQGRKGVRLWPEPTDR